MTGLPLPGTTPVPVHDAAHALSAFRCLPNGDGRKYSATTFPKDPWGGCNHIICMARAVGYLSDDHSDDDYAVLDVLNVDGDIAQDFAIPTSAAFRWFRRKLDLVVEADDACRGTCDDPLPIKTAATLNQKAGKP